MSISCRTFVKQMLELWFHEIMKCFSYNASGTGVMYSQGLILFFFCILLVQLKINHNHFIPSLSQTAHTPQRPSNFHSFAANFTGISRTDFDQKKKDLQSAIDASLQEADGLMDGWVERRCFFRQHKGVCSGFMWNMT